jgi:hypothetical protein
MSNAVVKAARTLNSMLQAKLSFYCIQQQLQCLCDARAMPVEANLPQT